MFTTLLPEPSARPFAGPPPAPRLSIQLKAQKEKYLYVGSLAQCKQFTLKRFSQITMQKIQGHGQKSCPRRITIGRTPLHVNSDKVGKPTLNIRNRRKGKREKEASRSTSTPQLEFTTYRSAREKVAVKVPLDRQGRGLARPRVNNI